MDSCILDFMPVDHTILYLSSATNALKIFFILPQIKMSLGIILSLSLLDEHIPVS